MRTPDASIRERPPENRGESLAASRRWARPRAGLLLAALCLAVYLPGLFTLPPVDRDESRFAQASYQMLESGDWVVPRFQDRTRLNKPPMIYWLQAAGAWLTGERPDDPDSKRLAMSSPTGGVWRYRLPSALAAIATVLLTWRLGCSMFDPRAATLGAAMLAVSPVFAWEAHQATSDQVLTLCVVATQAALWNVWRSRHASLMCVVGVWLGLAAGVLTKAPVPIMITGLTVLMLVGAGRPGGRALLSNLRPLVGMVIVAAVGGAWLALVARQVGWDHLGERLHRELIGRNTSAMEGHWGPPGYHLLLLSVLFWPGSLATLGGFLRSWRLGLPGTTGSSGVSRWLGRLVRGAPGRRAECFLFAWIALPWIVFEVVGTKLFHYTMPLYPAIALLSGRMMLTIAAEAARPVPKRLPMHAVAPWAAIGVLLVVVAPGIAGSFVQHSTIEALAPTAQGFCLRLAAILVLFAAARRAFRQPLRAQVGAIGASALAFIAIMIALPRIDSMWLSPRVLDAVRAVDPQMQRPLAAVGYHEDSLVFMTRGAVVRLDQPPKEGVVGFEEWARSHDGFLVVVPKDRLIAEGRAVDPAFSKLTVLEEVVGVQYADRARGTTLVVAEAKKEPR